MNIVELKNGGEAEVYRLNSEGNKEVSTGPIPAGDLAVVKTWMLSECNDGPRRVCSVEIVKKGTHDPLGGNLNIAIPATVPGDTDELGKDYKLRAWITPDLTSVPDRGEIRVHDGRDAEPDVKQALINIYNAAVFA